MKTKTKTKKMILTPTTPNDPPKNTYIIEFEVMHGDADKYESIEVEFKNKEYFIEMYNFFDSIINMDSDGETDTRLTIDNAHMHKMEEIENQNIENDERQEALEEWPGDCTCDGQYMTPIQSIDGRYYDENGREFRVTFK